MYLKCWSKFRIRCEKAGGQSLINNSADKKIFSKYFLNFSWFCTFCVYHPYTLFQVCMDDTFRDIYQTLTEL